MAHASAQVIDRWSGGTCPFEAGWRKVGLMVDQRGGPPKFELSLVS